MRNEVFVFLEIYSVYLKIYEYGKVVQGVRFPDELESVEVRYPDIFPEYSIYHHVTITIPAVLKSHFKRSYSFDLES